MFTIPEMVAKFDIADVNANPARFDLKKAEAINADHIRMLGTAAFAEACAPWLVAPYAPWAPEDFDQAVFDTIAPYAQTRLTVLSDITANVDFLFLKEPVFDEASWTKAMKGDPQALLTTARENLDSADWSSAEALKEAVLKAGEAHGLKLGKAQAPVRVAVTGRTVGLPLFESLQILGKDASSPGSTRPWPSSPRNTSPYARGGGGRTGRRPHGRPRPLVPGPRRG
ncbi:hypothetical protein ACFQVA_31210 [Actinomadura keratinilytica]